MDFGITKIFKENEKTDVPALSYYYSSPEISDNGKSQVTPKSDIFSFGLSFIYLFLIFFYFRVLYEIVTCKRAWKNYIGKGVVAIYNLIHGNYDFWKEN